MFLFFLSFLCQSKIPVPVPILVGRCFPFPTIPARYSCSSTSCSRFLPFPGALVPAISCSRFLPFPTIPARGFCSCHILQEVSSFPYYTSQGLLFLSYPAVGFFLSLLYQPRALVPAISCSRFLPFPTIPARGSFSYTFLVQVSSSLHPDPEKWHKNGIFFNMDLILFRQDIKKICLLIAFQQSLSSGQKTADFRNYGQILVKNCYRFIAGDLKAFFYFLLWFSSHWP